MVTRSTFLGGVLLFVGTAIGGGMLVLPTVTASGGLACSTVLILLAWLLMTFGALCILQVALWLPEGSNLVSMAKATLGPIGQISTWIIYLSLLYTLISAYIAGGTDITQYLLSVIHLSISTTGSALLFTFAFGLILLRGILTVDWVNRGFMSIKLGAYLLLVLLILPHIRTKYLAMGQFKLLLPAVMPVFTSFGYATIVPTIRNYFNSDARKIRNALILGSFVPLIAYFLWLLTLQGSIPANHTHGLIQIATSSHPISQLTVAMSNLSQHSVFVRYLVHVFNSICIVTAFLGVSTGLVDFLADGLQITHRTLRKNILITALTLVPPLLIVLIKPGIFIRAISYAGVLCILLLLLLPCLMLLFAKKRHLKLKHRAAAAHNTIAIIPNTNCMAYIGIASSIVLLAIAFFKYTQ